MFALFRRKRIAPAPRPAPETAKGFLIPTSPAVMLATPRRKRLLEHIWHRTSLSRAQFRTLYEAPLERYATLVQEFPASESHHHSYSGGMLDHTLETVAFALKLRQSQLLPIGAPPETQAMQSEAWTAATAYAALLHDIGKIAVDLHVEYTGGERWHPWHGALVRPYRFRYNPDRQYRLHAAASGLLYSSVLDTPILDWLSGFSEAWEALLYLLAGQYDRAGALTDIIRQADQASVAQELGGDPSKVQAAPRHTVQRKLLEGLRYLVREELKLNQPAASDGWLTDDAVWLVSKTVCDKLRAHLLSQGVEGIATNNVRLFAELQDHGIVQPTPDGKAIWRATITNGAWSHSFTFLKLSPALIWQGDQRPPAFNGSVRIENAEPISSAPAQSHLTVHAPEPSVPEGTSDPRRQSQDHTDGLLALMADSQRQEANFTNVSSPLDIELPESKAEQIAIERSAHDTGPTITEEEGSGEHFMRWLRLAIAKRHLIINDSKALVHTVAGTAYLVSPGIFQRYAQEHPHVDRMARAHGIAAWQLMQKHFERLGVHRKQRNGLNIWTCQVSGPRKTRRVHGYVLKQGDSLFADIPPDNPYLKLLEETVVEDASPSRALA